MNYTKKLLATSIECFAPQWMIFQLRRKNKIRLKANKTRRPLVRLVNGKKQQKKRIITKSTNLQILKQQKIISKFQVNVLTCFTRQSKKPKYKTSSRCVSVLSKTELKFTEKRYTRMLRKIYNLMKKYPRLDSKNDKRKTDYLTMT